MLELTVPTAAVLTALLATLAYMYAKTTDVDIQKQILGYVEKVVTFVIGALAGGAISGTAVYLHYT